MALNKRKVLDSARKFAQKGAKAKALKEYQLLLQADPRDAKLLLEVGDAYRRWGQPEDAIAQYGKVAQQYRQDGFDARAVAVYKQILNLDPKHYAAYVSLSELYQRMGLDAEAIGALQTAADGYHREGRKTDALELLRQMAALDPTNTTSRLKVAELLRQEKMPAEALAEYEAAARELENQQDRDQLVAVRERILELKPDHLGALTGMVRSLMVAGKLDRAEPFALRALQVSGEPAQYELVIELFAQMGNDAKLAEATRGLAKLHRDRGDEDKARELMQRLPADEVGARSRLAVDVSEVGEPQIDDEELLDDDPFVTVTGLGASLSNDLGEEELELEEDEEIQLETPKSAARPVAAPLVGDPDQLLAEASVYLRYGKRAQAIQSLRTVLDQDPNHRAALEKLGEAYADDGQAAEAVAIWLRAAEQVRKSGDAKALSVLRDRIATLDPKAAAQVVQPAAAESVAELELDVEVDLDEADASASASGHPTTVDVDEDAELGFDVELDEAAESFRAGADATEEVAAEDATPSISLAEDGTFEFEIDSGEISGDGADAAEGFSASQLGGAEEFDSAASVTAGGSAAASGTTTSTARIREELEEAEFYIDQQMYGEAETILTRILEIAPNHPSALLRMGEVQVARGSAPESVPAAAEVRTKAGRRVAGTSERDLGATARFEGGLDLDSPDASADLDLASDDDAVESSDGASGFELDVDMDIDVDVEMQVDAGGQSDLDIDGDVDVEVDVDVESVTLEDSAGPVAVESGLSLDGQDEETDPVVVSAPAVAIKIPPKAPAAPTPARPVAKPPEPIAKITPPPTPRPAPSVEPVVARTVPSTPTPTPKSTPPAIAAAPEVAAGDIFDLREALADVFNEPGEFARGKSAGEVLSTVEDGFESIFSDFKKGVSATLDKGDVDTRYDLGIAYREMGLFEDAIGEFKICLEASTRRFDSLYLMGLCARDLQRYGDAVHHLEQALALPDVPSDRTAGVFFDLSIAQSLAGDRERARANMRRVLELDPRFPNAAEKLAELEKASSPAGGSTVTAEGEGGGARSAFESFDDLFSEEESAEPAAVESFESFDDVVSEVEVVPVEDNPPPVPAAPAAIEPAPASDSNAQSGRKSTRKKISFV